MKTFFLLFIYNSLYIKSFPIKRNIETILQSPHLYGIKEWLIIAKVDEKWNLFKYPGNCPLSNENILAKKINSYDNITFSFRDYELCRPSKNFGIALVKNKQCFLGSNIKRYGFFNIESLKNVVISEYKKCETKKFETNNYCHMVLIYCDEDKIHHRGKKYINSYIIYIIAIYLLSFFIVDIVFLDVLHI